MNHSNKPSAEEEEEAPLVVDTNSTATNAASNAADMPQQDEDLLSNDIKQSNLNTSTITTDGIDDNNTTDGSSSMMLTSTKKDDVLNVDTAPSDSMPSNQNNNNNHLGTSSESEETEHLPQINNPSSELTTSNNDNNIMDIDNNNNSETVTDNIGINQQKHPSIPSMNSAARRINTNTNDINSRTCNANNTVKSQHHAYFASSEEESEAELDETLSHCSSRASNQVVVSQQHNQDDHDIIMKSSLRGSKKLEDIASKAFRASRVRMTIPEPADHDYKGKSGVDNLDSSKPKAAYSSSQMKQSAVPPPPQTVTVAVTGKKSDTQQHKQLSSPSILLSNNHPRSSTIQQQQQPQVAIGSSPIRKRIRKKKKKQKQQRHSQKHLPRGLPVFKDPRSCMWTSTHDANAPSEDRYSSLVNVLLRPPKTRRSKKVDNTLGEGIGKVDNGGTKDHSGSSEEEGSAAMSEEDNTQFQDNVTQSTPAVTTSTNTLPSNMNGNNNNNTNHKDNNNDNVAEDDEDNTSLVRLSLWSVIDGHGGGCVATYAAEVLLPHIAASVARALDSEIIDRGVCNVNGQLRDANALDLDGLIRSSDRSRHGKNQVRQREAGIDVVNPNSIHYRSPWEDSESEEDVGVDHLRRNIDDEEETTSNDHHPDDGLRLESESEAESEAPVSVASSLLPGNRMNGESVSSVKTSVKTAVSPVTHQFPVGTHSPAEVASITRAITDSFLAVDEGWINSIDPITTHQTSCVSNGRWNAGACALVVFIVQRLDWCRSSRVDHETHHRERGGTGGFEDTAHNTDAARRRKLDYAAKSKSISSLSTLSSTSSITTEANTKDEIGEESEITETEDDEDDVSDMFGPRRRRKKIHHHHHHNHHSHLDDPHHQDGVFIGHHEDGHYYRPHDAMLYTAHVGDCRAVMLGSAPPRTIKVPPEQGDGSRLSLDHSEDDSSSESIADEISSSEHDSDSSGDLMEDDLHGPLGSAKRGSGRAMGYGVRRSKRQRRSEKAVIQPFVPLPPLRRESDSEESTIASDNLSEEEKFFETEDEGTLRSVRSGSPTQMDRPPSPTQLVADPVHPPPLPLSMQMRPIDLTTDHSAYNPSEVSLVLRRSNNAPKAISSASSGGIKRVAGSLAVTRALGDAYLKTPRLSFFPYKRHAPYITGRPEVNCRVLTKGADRIVTLASDGVWERASGEDVLRWVRNYYNLRIAGVEEDQHLQQQHDVYNDNDNNSLSMSRKSRPTFANDEEDVLGSDGNETVAAIASVGSSEDISSEEDVEKIPASSIAKKPLEHNGDVLAKPPQEAHDGVGEVAVDSDAATTATSTTAVITTSTTAKAGSKRKHPATADESASSRSASTASFALGTARTSSRRHLRSSSRSHSATVSEVIVRKVLNKVRKTRNISSLRMLMSLPKGRARRSKHDDITATVIDLSGFVS